MTISFFTSRKGETLATVATWNWILKCIQERQEIVQAYRSVLARVGADLVAPRRAGQGGHHHRAARAVRYPPRRHHQRWVRRSCDPRRLTITAPGWVARGRPRGVEWRRTAVEPTRAQQIERLYRTALSRPVEDRTAFLITACGDDEALRREVESLLESPTAQRMFAALAMAVVRL